MTKVSYLRDFHQNRGKDYEMFSNLSHQECRLPLDLLPNPRRRQLPVQQDLIQLSGGRMIFGSMDHCHRVQAPSRSHYVVVHNVVDAIQSRTKML